VFVGVSPSVVYGTFGWSCGRDAVVDTSEVCAASAVMPVVTSEHEFSLPLLLDHGEADLNQATHENVIRDPVH
jgi:hypothetical protein